MDKYQLIHDEVDYKAGMMACEKGLECPCNATQAFIEGFQYQYEKEQQLTHKSVELEERHGTYSN